MRTSGQLCSVYFAGEVQQNFGLDLLAVPFSRVRFGPVEVLQPRELRAGRAPDDQVRLLLRELPPASRPVLGQQEVPHLAGGVRDQVEG